MSVQAQPVLGTQHAEQPGGAGYYLGSGKTNAAIKALYRELEKKNEELRALDKLKSEFVSMVSHELRTPLTIITSALSQLIDGLYGPDHQRTATKGPYGLTECRAFTTDY